MKKNKMIGRLILNTIIYFSITIIIVVGAFGFYTINRVIAESPKLDITKINSYEPTKVLDSKGELISTLGGELRENVTYNDLPQVLIDAFLAVEDSRFESHNGFDVPRFLKSLLVNVRAGGIEQGGSTITMQLIDNAYFDNVGKNQTVIQKLKQKIAEITMALNLESKTSKKDILLAYLNKINFGDNIRGVGKASEHYFGKHVSKLTLSEAAFLAGNINAPNLYNPYNGIVEDKNGKQTNYYKYATDRRDTALSLMKLHGYITDTEYQVAKNTDLAFQLNGRITVGNNAYIAYTDIVEKEVRELTGLNPHVVSMTIYTAMDKTTQDLSNRISNRELVKFPNKQGLQIGAAVIDNIKHELIAINPGFGNETGDNRKNFGYVEKNQIGSTSKPIVSYTPAFDNLNYSTGHVFDLKSIKYRGTNIEMHDFYKPKKYSFVETVAYSLNKTSLETFYRNWDTIGLAGYNKLMDDLGLNVPDVTDQFSIGAGDFRLTPYELAGAYSAIASKGEFVKPTTVRKVIVHSTGKEYVPEKVKKQPYSPQAAYLMSTILRQIVAGNYQNGLHHLRSSYPVYAKSGTSDWGKSGLAYDIPEDAARDNWTAAFSGNTTVATWMGIDARQINKTSHFSWADRNLASTHKITKLLLDSATKSRENVEIKQPDGIVTVKTIAGIYPYMQAPAELSGGIVTTGLAKKEVLSKIKPYEPLNIPTESGFRIAVSSDKKQLEFNFNAIQESELLGKATYVVTVTNASGKEVYKQEHANPSGKISITNYKDGKYTVTGSVKFSAMQYEIPNVAYEYNHVVETAITPAP